MEYREFKELFEKKIREYFSAEDDTYELNFTETKKPNCTYDGITLKRPDKNIAPCVYINTIYEQYEGGDLSIDEIAVQTLNTLKREADAEHPFVNNIKDDLKNLEDKIVFQLIGYEDNKDLICNLPHRLYLDLAITYRAVIELGDDGMGSISITNDLAQQLGYSEADLYRLAQANTKRLLPPTVKSMQETIAEILGRNEMFDLDPILDDVPPGMPAQYVISNEKSLFGATSMLYEDILHKLSEKIGGDLYILPSSLHELIVMPVSDDYDAESLSAMVRDVNETHVALTERLSNQVYYYDGKKREVSLASDVPNKSLNEDHGKDDAMEEMVNMPPRRKQR